MQEAAEPILIDSAHSNVFLARQPIFDAGLNVHAYELLFRSEDTSMANVIDGNVATSQVMINAFLEMGIETIADDRICFVNLTREFIVGELPLPLPPKAIVIEILEDVEVDDALLAALRKFSMRGFTIALDDYVFTEDKAPLFDLIDIVKIDIMNCDKALLAENVAQLKKHNLKLLAEKVETQEEFDLCKSLGFELFQGYFIEKPQVMKGYALKPGRVALLKILIMLEDPDCDIAVLEELISQDITLSYKILRIINSSFYGVRYHISSVKQAVVSLGLKTIRDWFIIVALTSIDDKPQELIFMTLLRARMMQNLAHKLGVSGDTGFTTGLFSAIDALMDQPMHSVLEALPLADDIVQALVSKEGKLGELLNLVLHYEKGDWQYFDATGLAPTDLSDAYFDAMIWARGLVRGT